MIFFVPTYISISNLTLGTFLKVFPGNQLTLQEVNVQAPGYQLPRFPVPDINQKLGDSANNGPNGAILAMATFMEPAHTSPSPSKSAVPSSPVSKSSHAKLKLVIPITTTSEAIIGYNTKYMTLFEDSPPDLLAIARTLSSPFPVIITHLTSRISSSSTYLNVTKASRIMKLITGPNETMVEGLKNLLGDDSATRIAFNMIEHELRTHETSGNINPIVKLPATPPSRLFNNKRPAKDAFQVSNNTAAASNETTVPKVPGKKYRK